MRADLPADLVIASDRGPVTAVRRDGRLVAEPGRGSLVATLVAVARSLPGRVAWVSTTTAPLDLRVEPEPGPVSVAPVLVDPREYRAYYDEIGVRHLWFAHHDLWAEVHGPPANPDAFAAYQRVNRAVAERVARAGKPRSPAFFQDYQLATAPGMLRALCPDRPIAHFTHTPFGPPAAFAPLPAALLTALVEGMLGADLLGFHSRGWAGDFLACCRAAGAAVDPDRGLVRHRGRRTWVRWYPLAVDAASVGSRSADPAADLPARPSAAVRRIMRADRLDPAKNLIRGFQAFELLLDRRPELRGRVSFLSLPTPSRERVPEYRSYLGRLDLEMRRIDARFPGAILVRHGLPRSAALAALRGYDVLLVNSLRDGMNLVAQEGPLVNAVDGAVVLSARTGSAGLLRDGALILADPRDVGETAHLLATALDLAPADRRRRAAAMRAAVQAHQPAGWMANQLADLREIVHGGRPTAGGW